jgi:manganese oxidase
MSSLSRLIGMGALAAGAALFLTASSNPPRASLLEPMRAAAPGAVCERTIDADLVALDQPIFLNRLGASLPGGMIYALRRDVIPQNGSVDLKPGQVQLRRDHRPRPLVLRVRVGDCLHIKFENLLAPLPLGPGASGAPTQMPCTAANLGNLYPEQTCTRAAGVHIYGMDETSAGGTLMDGSFVGANAPSTVVPTGTGSSVLPAGKIDYVVRAGAEGVFLLYSTAATADTLNSGGGLGGQLSAGLFGSVVVEPRSAEWYRSQVTKLDLDAATLNANALRPGDKLACSGNSCELSQAGAKTPIKVTKAPDGALYAADGHPVLNYAAVRILADGTCAPVLRMIDVVYQNVKGICTPLLGSPLVTYYGELTAAITGPNAGAFPPSDTAPPFNSNAVEPNRHEPYREFVEHYHDVLTVTSNDQAFPGLYSTNPVLGNGGEAFAINYGADGIGSEILANRVGTGPEGGCVDCRFEEFFLSAWAIGDPAELVGKPDGLATPTPTTRPVPYTPKTTLRADDAVQYPDDPSNVYHSYIGDRVVFRIVHAGQLVTHLHHLHAHQWLHSPNNDESTYLDSQLISPGSTYTQEIDYDGSGNRNRTVGDSIFHCHFYPHFAAGMWGMWRSHDVFEAGTDLAKDPTKDFARALPDGELLKGTPIPAIVPLPTIAMAPMPARTKICPVDRSWTGNQVLGADGACPTVDEAHLSGEASFIDAADFKAGRNPGYPFFLPGIAGQRAPHPPMSYPDDAAAEDGQTKKLDGGLARHVALAGQVSNDHSNAWDFSKDLDRLTALQLPEQGTPLEQIAMRTHNVCLHDSVLPDGRPGKFILNGGPSVPGAPFANPSWGTKGNIACTDLADPAPPKEHPDKPSRIYKAADIQTDVVFNKLGWHYPQERFETLWQDVAPTVDHKRAPEPLFFRANSGETIEFWQTNLVPAYYELDDYQVRTPTDVIGQHIHLVKFDVTSSDGAANGFNYEAGSLSSDVVREEIHAIRATNNCAEGAPVSFQCPRAKAPPAELGRAPAGQNWLGAQTTVERWWADPVMDNKGVDRTLRTVFTHDHFGPSTHQQIGLYAGLLVEPKGSKWSIPADPDPGTGQVRTAVPMGTRPDGGPTSWAADIVPGSKADAYREFALEFQGIALEYLAGSPTAPVPYPCNEPKNGGSDYNCKNGSVQPNASTPFWGWAAQASAINSPISSSATIQGLQPSLISVGSGGGIVNYRNEPLPARTQPPVGTPGHDVSAQNQDLGLAWASMTRNDPNLNIQPAGPTTLQAPEQPVTVNFPGKFVGAEPTDPYTPLLRAYPGDKVQIRVLVGAHEDPHTYTINGVKWLMEPSAENSGHVSAQPMGISEHFEMLFHMPAATGGARADYLYEPDANSSGQQDGLWGILRAYNSLQADLPMLPNNPIKPVPLLANEACPRDAHHVPYAVTAVTAAQAVPGGTLTYNSRTPRSLGPITQPDAILFVLAEDLDPNGKIKADRTVEPLILRAAAGDCVDVALTNAINPNQTDVQGNAIFNQPQPDTSGITATTAYNLYPSARAGLHAQLVDEDVTRSDGTRVGGNPDQTAAPGATVHYSWYAGTRTPTAGGGVKYTPMELGSINLLPADPVEQPLYGAAGALVIEPEKAAWRSDYGTRASATVFAPGRPAFREFVAVWQSTLNRTSYPNNYKNNPSPSAVVTGINYRSEPIAYRLPTDPDLSMFQSNLALAPAGTTVSGAKVLSRDPQTPIFGASGGMPTRFRFVNPSGQQLLTEVYGHHWQEEPWAPGSTKIAANPYSENMGATILGPEHALNLIIDSAGGSYGTPGDYLYRNFIATIGFATNPPSYDYAMWGLFRVGPPARDVVVLKSYQATANGGAVLTGYVTATDAAGGYAPTVRLVGPGAPTTTATVDPANGSFTLTLASALPSVTAKSAYGGEASAALPLEPLLAANAVAATEAPAAPAPVSAVEQALLQRASKFVNRSMRSGRPPAP